MSFHSDSTTGKETCLRQRNHGKPQGQKDSAPPTKRCPPETCTALKLVISGVRCAQEPLYSIRPSGAPAPRPKVQLRTTPNSNHTRTTLSDNNDDDEKDNDGDDERDTDDEQDDDNHDNKDVDDNDDEEDGDGDRDDDNDQNCDDDDDDADGGGDDDYDDYGVRMKVSAMVTETYSEGGSNCMVTIEKTTIFPYNHATKLARLTSQ